ncbi:hypothetical protein DFH11DRAFT_1725440 [Phellopilus nigrolimitatus]|nr:hypothetical protein DFH11DRAFT_1725440 [Phellopilus nigrolimitatus]
MPHADSSAGSSPANDLFRISLSSSSDSEHEHEHEHEYAADRDGVLAGTRARLAAAGHARFQDILEDASAALKRSLAQGALSPRRKQRMFDAFLREMREIAAMQEREVEDRLREEARFEATLSLSRSESGAGASGSGSGAGGLGLAFGAGVAGPSRAGPSMSASASSSSSSASGAATAQQRLIDAVNRIPQPTGDSDSDDGSSTEEETDRPPRAPAFRPGNRRNNASASANCAF